MKTIRVGIIGLGQNCRERHVPGLRACEGVEIVGVCNRRPESTAQAAKEFGIPRTYTSWEDLVADPDIDAIVIGTWPYLHAPATVAALEAGKHVLCEARMARNVHEAQAMVRAAERHPELVLQIVPSPFGLEIDEAVRQLLQTGAIGHLREVVVTAANDWWADPKLPLGWRQVRALSGHNMLMLGILHETLIRWLPDPVEVYAQAHAFIPHRLDPATGRVAPVELPDSLHALARLPSGAMVIYHMSAVVHFGPGLEIALYGSDGTIRCRFGEREQLFLGRVGEEAMEELDVEDRRGWQVERDFVAAIRGDRPVRYTDPATGLRYMAFTDAVALSLAEQRPVRLEEVLEESH